MASGAAPRLGPGSLLPITLEILDDGTLMPPLARVLGVTLPFDRREQYRVG